LGHLLLVTIFASTPAVLVRICIRIARHLQLQLAAARHLGKAIFVDGGCNCGQTPLQFKLYLTIAVEASKSNPSSTSLLFMSSHANLEVGKDYLEVANRVKIVVQMY
jgi:hypothetical protein